MAIIALPSKVYFESISSLQLQRGGLSMRSRYTGKRQAITFPFAMWTFEGTTIKMPASEAAEWRAFLTQLEGQFNQFRLPVPGTEGGPLSGFTGTITVGAAGAVAGATSMPVTATASKLILKRGDYFTVNDELKVAAADTTTDGSGNATLTFEPLLRSAVTSAMTLTTTSPTVMLCLADTNQADWAVEAPNNHQIKLKCQEAF